MEKKSSYLDDDGPSFFYELLLSIGVALVLMVLASPIALVFAGPLGVCLLGFGGIFIVITRMRNIRDERIVAPPPDDLLLRPRIEVEMNDEAMVEFLGEEKLSLSEMARELNRKK